MLLLFMLRHGFPLKMIIDHDDDREGGREPDDMVCIIVYHIELFIIDAYKWF